MTIYKLYESVKEISVGGFVSIFVLISLFIEITPIKLNPIQWLGNRINKTMFDKVNNIEKKVDQHIAEGYRNSILNFQDKLLNNNTNFTLEEWQKVIDTCTAYEEYCKENDIPNDVIKLAIQYINQEYLKALGNKNFLNLPLN